MYEELKGVPPREDKIMTTVAMGVRQLTALTKTSRGLGISMQEFLRRMIDKWIREGTPEL